METSVETKELFLALYKTAKEIVAPEINKKGNRSEYADISSVLHAIKAPLDNNNLVLTQVIGYEQDKHTLTTMIYHVPSGQWLKGTSRLVLDALTNQGVCGSVTYFRRYSITAMLRMPQKDDDAQKATDEQDEINAKEAQKVYDEKVRLAKEAAEEKRASSQKVPKPIITPPVAPTNANTISNEQYFELVKYAPPKSEYANKIISAYKIQSLDQLPAGVFDKVLNRLKNPPVEK